MKKTLFLTVLFAIFSVALVCYAGGFGSVDVTGGVSGGFQYDHGNAYQWGLGNYQGGTTKGNGNANYEGSGFLFATGGANLDGKGLGDGFKMNGDKAFTWNIASMKTDAYFAGLGCGDTYAESNVFQSNWAGVKSGDYNFLYGGNNTSGHAVDQDHGLLCVGSDTSTLAGGFTYLDLNITPTENTSKGITAGFSSADCQDKVVYGFGILNSQVYKEKTGGNYWGVTNAWNTGHFEYNGHEKGIGFVTESNQAKFHKFPNGIGISATTKNKAFSKSD